MLSFGSERRVRDVRREGRLRVFEGLVIGLTW